MQFDKETEPSRRAMSSFWAAHLGDEHDLGPTSVTVPERGYTLVFAIRVGDAVSGDCHVDHDPWGPNPIDCAHSSVVMEGQPTKDARERIRRTISRRMTLVHGNPTTSPPPRA